MSSNVTTRRATSSTLLLTFVGFIILVVGSLNIYIISSLELLDNGIFHFRIQDDREIITNLRARNQLLEIQLLKMKQNDAIKEETIDIKDGDLKNFTKEMSKGITVSQNSGTQQQEGVGHSIVASASDFVRHDNVAIVTKIHGEHQWSLAEQSLCLLHYAYNHKGLYDIIIFTTDPVAENLIQDLQAAIAPTKVSVVVDNKGLQNEIADLSPEKYEAFKKRCNYTDTGDLTWFSECNGNRLAYNWQAEFRGKRLWHHPALAEYETMLWMDTDGFPTKPWEKDPVDYFVRNDGVIMFQNFQGHSKYYVQKGIAEVFNKTICKMTISDDNGWLEVENYMRGGRLCFERGVPNIHGFFHITNLDFYRSPVVTKGLDAIFGDCFLCRQPDDQLAVTVPAAVLAPDRSWALRQKGFQLDVFHNSMLDGIDQAIPAGYIKYWAEFGLTNFPQAYGVCKITNGN